MAEQVCVRALGSLQLGGAESPLLRSARLRRLLAVLLVHHDSVVSVDRLADALWGDGQPADPDGALQSLVWRLRTSLRSAALPGDTDLLTRAPGYLLAVDGEQVDVVRFQRLVDAGRVRLHDRPEEAAALLDDALGLWRGPAYAEFADEEFARGEAARLEELRLEALADRVDAALVLGRHTEVIGRLEFVVAEHPLRERPRAQLMLALHRIGRSPDALASFREHRELLAEELGLDPSPGLRDLEAAIIRQDSALASPAAVARPARAVPPQDQRAPEAAHLVEPAGNLPLEATGLVGRADDTGRVRAALERVRVVTVTGVGGVGKTRLALRAAADAQAGYQDGAWLCELATVQKGALVPDVVATVLGVQQRHGRTVIDGLVEYLRPKRLLLVLDNCEHVLDEVAHLVDALVGACSATTVLATSREPIGVDGEQVLPVQPLPVPPRAEPKDVAATAAVPSVALFVERAVSASPAFVLDEANATAVSEICRRLDGLPLALELAATRVRCISVDEIAGGLGRRLQFLRSARRIREERHRTLRSVVDWSYELLGPAERRVFERLSVFAGPLTLDAAAQVAGGEEVDPLEVADIVAGLVDKSLIVAYTDSSPTRFAMLETLRAYGWERLGERGETATACRAHARYHVGVAEAAATGLCGPDEASWAESLASLLDDLRSAHRWAIDHDPGLALRMSAGLFWYVETGAPSEVVTWAEHAAAAAGQEHAELLPVVLAAAAGVRLRGDLAGAAAYAQRALAILGDTADPLRRYPLGPLGEVALFEGRLQEAARLFTAVTALAEGIGDVYLAASATAGNAMACAYQGHTRRALELANRARQRAVTTGNPTVTGWADYALGEALLDHDPTRARAALDRALGAARGARNRFLTGVTLVSVASLHARHGDPHRALRLFGEAIDHWSQVGNWTQQWVTLRNVIDLLTRLDAPEPAAVLYGALTASSTAVPAFGADAERLAVGRTTLRETLGADRFCAVETRGAALDDDQAVAFAEEALDRLAAPEL